MTLLNTQGDPFGGQLVTEPDEPGLGRLNQSGIALDCDKQAQMPPGWNERPGYRHKANRHGVQEVYRVFVGPWSTYLAFLRWALGYSYSTAAPQPPPGPPPPGSPPPPPAPAGQLHRQVPAQHPRLPWLYADDFELLTGKGAYQNDPDLPPCVTTGSCPEPLLSCPPPGSMITPPLIFFYDGGTGSDAYSAEVAITYRPLPYEVRGDRELAANGLTELNRYVERQGVYALTSLPVPGYQLKFVTGDKDGMGNPIVGGDGKPILQVINEAAGNKMFPTEELTYTWYEVPDVPVDAIQRTQGKVNKTLFDPPVIVNGANVGGVQFTDKNGTVYKGFPPGTLLCLAPHKERIPRTHVGRVNFNIAYKFLFRTCILPDGTFGGWNHFPRVQNTTSGTPDFFFDLATINGDPTGPTQYESAVFADLFVPPYPLNYQGPLG